MTVLLREFETIFQTTEGIASFVVDQVRTELLHVFDCNDSYSYSYSYSCLSCKMLPLQINQWEDR